MPQRMIDILPCVISSVRQLSSHIDRSALTWLGFSGCIPLLALL
jgi:hypothetical protein